MLPYGPPGTGDSYGLHMKQETVKHYYLKLLQQSVGQHFCIFQSPRYLLTIGAICSSRKDHSGSGVFHVLFEMTPFHAPSTILLDELDSLMCQRGSGAGSTVEIGEHEWCHRIKTQLLIQTDGLAR